MTGDTLLTLKSGHFAIFSDFYTEYVYIIFLVLDKRLLLVLFNSYIFLTI